MQGSKVLGVVAPLLRIGLAASVLSSAPAEGADLLGPWRQVPRAEPDAAPPRDLLSIADSGLDWREARRIVELGGGRIVHVFPPDLLVGNVPEAARDLFARPLRDAAGQPKWSAERITLVRSPDELEARTRSLASSQALDVAREFLRCPQGYQSGVPLPLDLATELPMGGFETPPLEAPEPSPQEKGGVVPDALGTSFYDTSEFAAGDVGVGILLPESNGTDGYNDENWTAGEVSMVVATRVVAAMDLFAASVPHARLTFVYRTESFGPGVPGTVDCNYEARRYPNFDSNVLMDLLGKLGYQYPASDTAFNRLTNWVNDVRSDFGTDWAFGCIIPDGSATGVVGDRASAYRGGPALWMMSLWGPQVIHHETGHIFGALDEYHPDAAQSATNMAGYTREVDANTQYNNGVGFFGGAGEAEDALMISNVPTPSLWTRGMWGTFDLDRDGVAEPQDTNPAITSFPFPSGGCPYTFTGTAQVSPLRVEPGATTTADISINKITGVEWRMNGFAWQEATPVDGAFDSPTEGFTFTTPALRYAGYQFEVRARDDSGNVTQRPARWDIACSAPSFLNMAPVAAMAVTPRLGSLASPFLFDATGTLDPEEGASGLTYRWDFDDDGSYDTGFSATPTASHTYSTAGLKTARLEARDRQGMSTSRTIGLSVAAANVPPTPSLVVTQKGILPATTPILFDFSAAGSTDDQDAASALEVRWDFEDDGTWDTAFSTTKTASHDYAVGYPRAPAYEHGVAYLSGTINVPQTRAQSFVAETSSIAKVEVFLHVATRVAGGIVTLSIRSDLDGPDLTSVTKNQGSFPQLNWSTWDVPDIAVTPGSTYYIVLADDDGDLMWRMWYPGEYANGQDYVWTGTAWNSAGYDMNFRVIGGELAPTPLTKSGFWRVRAEVRDSSGATAQVVRDLSAIAYDSPPSVTAYANSTTGTTATTYSLFAVGTDPDQSTSWDGFRFYRWDDDDDGNYETFYGTSLRTINFARSGIYPAKVEVRDRFHLTATSVATLTVAPTLVSITVYDRTSFSQATTDERTVLVSLNAIGMPEQMLISGDPCFSDATWKPFAPWGEVLLSPGAGPKTVYVKTRSGVGNESGVALASITYAPPSLTLMANKASSDVDLSWNDGGAYEYTVRKSAMPSFASPAELQTSPLPGLSTADAGVVPDGQNWYYSVDTDPSGGATPGNCPYRLYIALLNGASNPSAFEINAQVPLPAQGWSVISGGAQIFDLSTNGALIGDTPYGNYQVQYDTGVAIEANAFYDLDLKLGFLAGLGGGTANWTLEFGTLSGSTFTVLDTVSGSTAFLGNLGLGVTSGWIHRSPATGAVVSGDRIAIRFAQTGSTGAGTSDYFGIDEVSLYVRK